MRAYAFLDRDGTLVRERTDEEWRGVRTLDLLPGVAGPLRAWAKDGYDLVVVTNQYLIGEGFLTRDDYTNQTASLLDALDKEGISLLDVLHCAHARGSGCRCHKPGVGLLREAERRHGPIDPARSFVVGDALTDMEMALAAGLPGYLLSTSPAGALPAGIKAVPTMATVVDHHTPSPAREADRLCCTDR